MLRGCVSFEQVMDVYINVCAYGGWKFKRSKYNLFISEALRYKMCKTFDHLSLLPIPTIDCC